MGYAAGLARPIAHSTVFLDCLFIMKIGVLALQGDFAEHIAVLKRLGQAGVEVRLPAELDGLDGLIIPGGESTTIGKLAVQYGLMDPLRALAASKPVWGTCAGAIFLSRDARRAQPLLGLMDIQVERNAFGRQVDSFETELDVPALAGLGNGRHAPAAAAAPFHAVFIRAPLIEQVGPGVDVLARLGDGRIVAARQGHLLATSFHPELTPDDRFHRLFLSLVQP
jgi:5'-phosphate synthase pdxT subunit